MENGIKLENGSQHTLEIGSGSLEDTGGGDGDTGNSLNGLIGEMIRNS